ncbi:ricin-type beta-trefoil lectin domain protein [Amycolatopsis nigrescens]|uniref:ricin-type beta-trefoil lectin domain protein n=1 Tax=Amycolatopsis nigrescens TaxID=381445 RepID=UPI0003714BA4|nr:ricin-type beta-trefoil lectin domain protein [Amycolatopsis nigrescens]
MFGRGIAAAVAVMAATVLSGTAHASTLDGADLRPRINENKCADIYQYNNNNGAPLVLWDCTGADNQRWAGGATIDGDIVSAWNGKCVTAVPRPGQSFRDLQMFDCTGGANQHWLYDKSPFAGEALCLKFEPMQCLWWNTARGLYVEDITMGDGNRSWYFH